MVTCMWDNIGSGCGLVPHGTKPLPKPMWIYDQWGSFALNLDQFQGAIWPSLSPCTIINPILLTYLLTYLDQFRRKYSRFHFIKKITFPSLRGKWVLARSVTTYMLVAELSPDTGHKYYRMTSSNGNIFRVTGPLCGEFTGPRWIPRTKVSDAELWCFLWSASE